MSLAHGPLPDLIAARADIASARTCATDLLRASLRAADQPVCARAFVRRFDSQALACAEAVDRQFGAGAPLPPLAGLAVTVKDLFDVAGAPTTAASRAMDDAAPAAQDATVVQRLRAAGAALCAHTNLSEFAFSGVGINPHFGTPAHAAVIDGPARVPGGSTAGGATSVAAGAAWAALGSDTGGSIRIPAALQGLVGFKNTQRLTPLTGCVPLSGTLDTACAITRSVRDAVLLHEVLAARSVRIVRRTESAWRMAVVRTLMLDDLDADVARAFDGALARLRGAGFVIDEIDLPPLSRLAQINAAGGFAAAESWSWHRERLERRAADYDPRVALRIRRGAQMSAADYIDLLAARATWIDEMTRRMVPYDALLSPTVPMVAPLLDPLLADDAAFFATNARLLRNPSAVNFLDGCALSLPCPVGDGLPVGLMLWSRAMSDDTLLSAALDVEACLAAPDA